MNKISLNVKRKATKPELLNDIKDTEFESLDIEIQIEEPRKEPTLSQAPLGEYIPPEALEYIKQLLTADSIIRLTIEGIIQGIAFSAFIKFFNKIASFISLNNKQKGNSWGAKIEITNKVNKNQTQSFCFFLDNIPESILSEATSKTTSKIEQFRNIVGEEYVNKLKIIGFTFSNEEKDWKVLGVELFDGNVEIPTISNEK